VCAQWFFFPRLTEAPAVCFLPFSAEFFIEDAPGRRSARWMDGSKLRAKRQECDTATLGCRMHIQFHLSCWRLMTIALYVAVSKPVT